MISQIHIKNFKSIVDLTLDLGRVNLFIGENGSGKSNILEAVAFANSSVNTELNNSILALKGVRNTNNELFCSAFEDEIQDISLEFIIENYFIGILFRINKDDNSWREIGQNKFLNKLTDFISKNKDFIEFGNTANSELLFTNDALNHQYWNAQIKKNTPLEIGENIKKEFDSFELYHSYRYSAYFTRYMVYSPEASSLRKFEEEGQIKPLGARGEGLFSLIKSMAKDNGSLEQIKEHLDLIDWYEDFVIPKDLMSNEYRISIKDRFINSDLKYLDQRSANEGFLFLLFYIVLFSSKKTPQFFAIDNIEASFNPKLCAKLISTLVELAKKNDKQVLMTTHNPATLDGLNLNDPEQRLFVVERNIDGHTIATRITEKPKLDSPMKLSEMWTKGFLGGLPENF